MGNQVNPAGRSEESPILRIAEESKLLPSDASQLSFVKPLSIFLALSALSLHAAEPELHVYFGNLHSHTGYSDGVGTPEEAFLFARDVAKLDFLAVTEHNHLLGGDKATPAQRIALYVGPAASALVPTARRLTEDGRFVAISGQEFSTMSKGNHVNVFDVPAVIDVPSGDFAGLLKWMAVHPDSTGHLAVLQLNHPALGRPGKDALGPREFGRDDFGGDAGWEDAMGRAASLVEILNGEPPEKMPSTRAPQIMEHFYLLFLQLGFHVAPTGDQDNHHGKWGSATEARTGIIAPALTKNALLEALRARHVYATEDRNLRVIARVSGKLCGDVLTATEPETKIELQIEDADEPDASYQVEVFQGEIGGPLAAVVRTASFHGNCTEEISDVRLDHDGQFLFLRITQSGAEPDRVWTAPVWLQLPKT